MKHSGKMDKRFNGQAIADEAMKWIGTPYSHHAAIYQKGCDCVGLLSGILKRIGYMDKDYKVEYYPKDWMLHRSEEKLIGALEKYSVEINRSELSAGDILLFKFGRAISHAGIFLKDNLFIHSWTKNTTGFAVLKNSLWEERLAKIVRLDYEHLPIPA